MKNFLDYAIKHNLLRFTVLTLTAGAFLLVLTGCNSKSEGAAENGSEKLIPSVEAVQARYGSLPLSERLTGEVRAKNQIEIYPEISAVIVSVHVKNGDVVEKGRPLVHLRDKEFQERLKQARASYQITVAQAKQSEAKLKEIKAQLRRTESLADKELASPAELEAAQTQAVSAEADLELARARVEQAMATVDERKEALAETVIRAPVSGSIGNRHAEVGMLVSPGTRLFTMGQLDNVKVEIVLTDRMLNYIEAGQRTEILTENNAENAASDVLQAPLSRISPFLHPVTHSTNAEIDLANKDKQLIPGMFVTVDVFYGESDQATLVPLSALYENPSSGVTGVFVCRDSLNQEPISGNGSSENITLSKPVPFQFVQTEVVAKGRMQAGIRGVKPGDWIVTLGQNLLGSDSATARVHTVKWGWVEELQNLQRQDLLQEVMKRQQEMSRNTPSGK